MKTEMTAVVETVSPETAIAWLKLNHPGNRPISLARVETYKTTLRAGEWILFHQGVAFDEDGFLVDGQHRLTAIMQTGLPVRMLVSRNVDRRAYQAMDNGRPRTLASRTRLAPRVAEPLRLAAALLRSNPDKVVVTPLMIEALPQAFHDAVVRVVGLSQQKRKGVTSAPVVVALAGRMMLGNAEWIGRSFRALINLDFDGLDPAPKALLRACLDGRASPKGSKTHLFATAWNFMDYNRRQRVLPRCTDINGAIYEFQAAMSDAAKTNAHAA